MPGRTRQGSRLDPQAVRGDVCCLYLGWGLGCGLETHGVVVIVRGGDGFHAPGAGTDLLLCLLTAVRAEPSTLGSPPLQVPKGGCHTGVQACLYFS